MTDTIDDSPAAADAASSTTPRRTFQPRRGLPTGRAIVGALLVTVSAVGAFAIATTGDDGPSTEYLVLIDDVEAGATVELDDVAFAAMELAPEVAATALRTTNGLEGATALQHLRAGQLLDVRSLNGAAFVDGAPVVSVHELTIPVQRNRAPERLRRGDRVTILAFDDSADILFTALEDALVLSFDTESPGIINSDEAILTLALPDSELVARGTYLSFDEVTVVLTSRALDDEYDPEFVVTAGEVALTAEGDR